MHRLRIFSILFILCLPLGIAAQNSSLKAIKKDGRILVRDGDEKVFVYQKAPKSHKDKYTRNNYIHPLYDLDGNVLTEDFPEDHLHQRGIFWAWHQVIINGRKIGDMWTTEDFEWDVASVDTRYEEQKLILQPVVYWKSPDFKDKEENKKAFAKEETSIAIHPKKNGKRAIDFTIRIHALQNQLYIGGSDNEKGYGGFSLRIKLPENITFTAEYGQAEPKNTAVSASPWMDFTGAFTKPDHSGGILVLAHPSNPDFPPEWIIRDKGSMQNPVYPGRKPEPVPQSQPLTLRYRMIVHKNALGKNAIDQLVATYNEKQIN